ncbi:hypothetical protein WCQ02_36025 [Paraburkholderia tropica]|uniref:Uncharacterized protein n=1 Tax=Paraburkholderia tropica TaxID=92647 RepID=A0ABX5MG05_9BURK|nr:hypothetical protein [Paraburkholderia tropica]PXX07045.1 hypothetical protein C7400_13224 [Paraburkholderia tropica]PZW72482.1 hypothetical protein C7399_13224 [Paraburkholderia tropica]
MAPPLKRGQRGPWLAKLRETPHAQCPDVVLDLQRDDEDGARIVAELRAMEARDTAARALPAIAMAGRVGRAVPAG